MVDKRDSKSMKKNFLLLAITILFGLLVMEFTLRLVSPPVRKWVFLETTQTPKAKIYGWTPVPYTREAITNPDTGEISFYTTNSQGWKDVEHQFEKPEGVIRILFVGDSHTQGIVPIDDLYTRQTELLLKNRGFSIVEVIGIGVAGWGTDQALEALQMEGIKYQPDIVVYQFCGNDVTDNLFPLETTRLDSCHWMKRFKYKLVNGALKKIKLYPKIRPISAVDKIKKSLLKSALIYNIDKVKEKMIRYLQEKKNRKKQKPIYEAMRTRHWWEKYPINPLTTYYRHTSIEQTEELREGWELFEALIIKMKEIVEKNNAKFIVFSEEGENGKRIWHIKRNLIQTNGFSDYIIWHGTKYPVDMKRPLKNLKRICKKHEIPLIEPKRQYDRFNYDQHPNKTGNIRMAQDIVDFLVKNELLYKQVK